MNSEPIVLTDEQKKENLLRLIREDRNKILAKTDWTQLPDNALSTDKKNEWRLYRQALRDLTLTLEIDPNSNYVNTWNTISWPTPPTDS